VIVATVSAETPRGGPAVEAERLRTLVWNPDRFPVDPVAIARALGIDVRQAMLKTNVSGALVKKIGEDPAILLNASDSPNRQRFTCAHELGHYVTHASDPTAYEYIDLRDTIWSATGQDSEEVWANAFAANLLMPEKRVRELIAEGYTPTALAAYFAVSQDAMSYRLDNLGLTKDS
jgi:Zn-dependent peptidase ImmA (M78 family)